MSIMSDGVKSIIRLIIAVGAICLFFTIKHSCKSNSSVPEKQMGAQNQHNEQISLEQQLREKRDKHIQVYESMIENNRLESSSRITGSMQDRNSNRYRTVTIGNQVWMAENMRATHDRYGNPIELVVGEKENKVSPSRFEPFEGSNVVQRYGYLYNWEAAMKVCPAGWHLPTEEDWTQLENYVSSQSQYVCGEDKKCIAKSLADTIDWHNTTTDRYRNPQEAISKFGTIGDYPKANNATGFSALPAEKRNLASFGWLAVFWSATEQGEDYANALSLTYDCARVSLTSYGKSGGHSVRCVRD